MRVEGKFCPTESVEGDRIVLGAPVETEAAPVSRLFTWGDLLKVLLGVGVAALATWGADALVNWLTGERNARAGSR